MSYRIRYSASCITGAVRRNNQDNLLLGDFYLPENNRAMEDGRTGAADCEKSFTLAVFDGIGGAPRGEAAAYITAKSMSMGIGPMLFPTPEKIRKRLSRIILRANDSSLQYRDERRIRDYGCTAAGIWFCKKYAGIFNVGDSRIYSYCDGTMKLASKDHTVGRGILSQYIGMDEREGTPEPEISVMNLKKGLQFLICSDGLTACMSDREIEEHFREKRGKEFVTSMMDIVKRRGSPDNTTVIWCQVI